MRTAVRALVGFYFYPRGGSAHVCRAICRELGANGVDVRLLAGSRSDIGEAGLARSFFAGLDPSVVDFTPALRSSRPLNYHGSRGTAPMHGSYEDREGAEDVVLAALGADEVELQVDAWSIALADAAPEGVDVLYLHHLTPLNEAAARVLPGVPVVGHVHGTELAMLERIEAGPPPGWTHAPAWAARMRRWAGECERVVVNDPGGLQRAARALRLDPSRFAQVPNGFEAYFSPGPVDRRAHWRDVLVERPRGWRPGAGPGSVSYAEGDLDALEGLVLLSVGRFTAVKRVPLLIEAFSEARRRIGGTAALVVVGGYPGEWEGEHPFDAIRRTGAEGVYLAGWHEHARLPAFMRAADVLVHAAVGEQFGQVVVEAMACALPAIAVDRGGPATIVDDPATGWLVPPDDRAALAGAIVEAAGDEEGRVQRGRRARREALRRYAWPHAGERLASLVRAAAASRADG